MPNDLAVAERTALRIENASSFFSAVERLSSGVWGEIAASLAPRRVISRRAFCSARSSRFQYGRQPPR
jgi:hypothetical protein